ncbi:hypothetical protein CSH63_24880 [Micromonospora tulbaghiae]|uniref:Uncharacterized protein n=1 Tax=Micromonospora tulbaghiae TaxID=479978 RepID=A0A386WTH1_9ACTN|nr:hypothetical protein CSH63_24880 [Micromonospora tulbaghiae]
MHPQDPYQQPQPYSPQQYPPPPPPMGHHALPPPPPPAVVVNQQTSKAATVGIWVIVAWLVGPLVVVLLCCAGCMFSGTIGAVTGVDGGASPTSTP